MNTALLDLAASPPIEMRRRIAKMSDEKLRKLLVYAYLGQLEEARQSTDVGILQTLLTADLETIEKFISNLRLAIWADDLARRASPPPSPTPTSASVADEKKVPDKP